MSNKYTETLFDSISAIVDKKIEKLDYDITLVCTIVSVEKALQGKYTVKHEAAQFYAYSEKTNYQVNDIVYVCVPKSDFNQTKYITGKVVSDVVETTSISPYENYVQLTDDLNTNTSIENDCYFCANDGTEEKIIFNRNYTDSGYFYGYTRLGIKTNLSLNLSNAVSGNYGLKIRLEAINLSTFKKSYKNIVDGDFTSTLEFTLDTSDFFAVNLYKLNGNQSKFFDISNYLIKKITVVLFQDNNFKDSNGVLLESNNLNLIKLKSMNISLGYEKSEFTDNMLLYLFSEDGYCFDKNYLQKKLSFRLLKRNDDNTATIIKDFASSKLYRYSTNGSYSQDLQENNYILSATASSGVTDYSISLDNNMSIESEKYKIYLLYAGNGYVSNSLSLTNINYVPSSEVLDIIQGLSMSFSSDENEGIYNIYGQDGQVLNSGDAFKTRQINVSYTSSEGRTLHEGDVLRWTFSPDNTMIVPIFETGYEKTQLTSGKIQYQRTITATEESNNLAAIKYKIKSCYNPLYINNTITCDLDLVVNEIQYSYSSSKELTFGFSGSQGADYILNLSLWRLNNSTEDEQVQAILPNDSATYYIKAELKNYINENLDIDTSCLKAEFAEDTDSGIFETDYFQLFENGSKKAAKINITLTETKIGTGCGCSSTLIVSYELYNNKSIKAYFPIAIRSKDISYIEGPSTIVYDITGKKPIYSKAPYKAYTDTSQEISCTWDFVNSIEDNVIILTDNTLIPSCIYQENIKNIAIKAIINNSIAWIQPIYITQNQYPIAMENTELNQLNIDKNSIISAIQVGKVVKNNNGTYRGIVFGKVSDTLGLYAYSDSGTQVFKLDEYGNLSLDGGLAKSLKITNSEMIGSNIVDSDGYPITIELSNTNSSLNVSGTSNLTNITVDTLTNTTSATFNGTVSITNGATANDLVVTSWKNVGTATNPIYFDANGVPKQITSYSGTADKAKKADSATTAATADSATKATTAQDYDTSTGTIQSTISELKTTIAALEKRIAALEKA